MQGNVWSRSIAALLPKTSWVLALDRTTWERGETVINLLVLCVVAQYRTKNTSNSHRMKGTALA